MSFDEEEVIESGIDKEYDMIPINTYISQMNNYKRFSNYSPQSKENYQMNQFNHSEYNNEIKPMTYYKLDHSLGYNDTESREEKIKFDGKSRRLDCDDFIDVNNILMKIERYNPGVFQFLRRYDMSYEDAKKIIKKIITVTLMYEND